MRKEKNISVSVFDINKHVLEIIDSKNIATYHNEKLKLKIAYELMIYLYNSPTASIEIGYSCYGDLLNDALEKSLLEIENQCNNNSINTTDKNWFIDLFKKYINNFTVDYRNRNTGAINREKHKLALACLDKLLDKYSIPKTGRPGGDQENDNILNTKVVRNYLDGKKESYHIIQAEIDDVCRYIKSLQAYSEGYGKINDDDIDTTETDLLSNNVYSKQKEDAKRFIGCAKEFYYQLENMPDFNAKASSLDVKIQAKDFMTLELLKCRPSAYYLSFVTDAGVINTELYHYAEREISKGSLPNDRNEIYARYLTNIKNKKRSGGTIRKELKPLEDALKVMVKEAQFESI